MVYSLEQGLDPSWDAANETSSRLAQKLGYTPQGTYNIAVVVGSGLMVGIMRLGLKIKKLLNK